MRGKLLFVAGIGVGYVVGARQGRMAYERLRRRAAEALQSPAVQKTVVAAKDLVASRVPVVGRPLSSALGGLVSEDRTREASGAGGAD